MNLSEYLKRPEVAPLTIAEKVVSANAFELTEHVKIEGAVRKTAVETTNLMYDTTERLAAFEPAAELEVQYHDAARDIAKNIEKNLKYPGEIKVVVIRENRAIEVAR